MFTLKGEKLAFFGTKRFSASRSSAHRQSYPHCYSLGFSEFTPISRQYIFYVGTYFPTVDSTTAPWDVVCDDYVNEGVFCLTTSSSSSTAAAAAAAGDDVIPPTTTELVNICQYGAFRFVGFDNKGKAILHARASLLNWRKINVDDGIKYHILVIENALKAMVMRNNNVKKKEANGMTPPANMILVFQNQWSCT